MMPLYFHEEYPNEVWFSLNEGNNIMTFTMTPDEGDYFNNWCYMCHNTERVKHEENFDLEFDFQWKITDNKEIALFLMKWGPGIELV